MTSAVHFRFVATIADDCYSYTASFVCQVDQKKDRPECGVWCSGVVCGKGFMSSSNCPIDGANMCVGAAKFG